MRAILAVGVAALAVAAGTLAACDAGAPAPTPTPVAEPVAAVAEPPVAAAAFPATSCDDIAKLAAAMSEPQPFASLRTGKVKLGERELDDAFTTAATPAGATCTMAVMDGAGPGAGKMHVVNCSLFSSGMLDRDANADKAKAVFNAARLELDKCLPAEWIARDGSQTETDTTEMMIYESPADAQRSMDDTFYLYPVQLRKEWAEGGAGRMPGWNVTLNFQMETGRKATAGQ